MKKYLRVKDKIIILKKGVSLLLVLLTVYFSSNIVYAFPNENNLTKISNKLLDNIEFAEESHSSELFPVYIWYEDIDQSKVDESTEKVIGLTKEECSILDKNTSVNLSKASYTVKNDTGALEEYIKSTDVFRKEEQKAVEKYMQTHRSIARKEYNIKSQNLIDELDIVSKKIYFNSNYAPLIIAYMTADEIKEASKNSIVESLGYFDKAEYFPESIESALTTTNSDKINAGTELNLTGHSVKVGIVDVKGVVLSNDNEIGISPENTTPMIRNTSDGTAMTDYGNIVIVGDTPYDSQASHADVVANTLLSVSPNIVLYSSNYSYKNIEAMISDGVQIISMSLGSCVYETDDNYAYTLNEKWFDHIISNHNVTFIKSAGNMGGNYSDYTYIEDGIVKQVFGARVTSPGMAYNGITVGCYYDVLSNDSKYVTTDALYSFSSYKDSANGKNGCEKPDVIMPSNFNGNGTSNATPFLAGIIALMYELRPSLANYPHVMKAIVLASCHRKVQQYTENMNDAFVISGEQETMEEGITERQGAGAPDAWTMACIVSQGTYGFGTLLGTTQIVDIIQPKYNADNVNVSLTWIRENNADNNHLNSSAITDGRATNLNLGVFDNDILISLSNLEYSSTEMCYFNISEDINNYELNISQVHSPTYTRYAFAWSTDKMDFSNITNDGVYYLRNKNNNKMMYCNTSNDILLRSIKNQSNLENSHQWILKSDVKGEYKLITGKENVFGGISAENNSVTLSDSPSSLELIENDDGTVSFVSNGKILSNNNSTVMWESYDGVILSKQKWYLEKNNYLRGDVQIDGDLNILDLTLLQRYLAGIVDFSSTQLYLSDINYDGKVDIMDATKLQNILLNQ